MSRDLPTGLSPAHWRIWQGSRDADISNAMEPGETWIGGWEEIGLYEGNNKIPQYQSTTVHITTHRLIVIPDSIVPSVQATSSRVPPLQSHMSNVRQTELYAGFMRSSPKITLSLGGPVASSSTISQDANGSTVPATAEDPTVDCSSWTCGVCGFVNPIQGFGTPSPSTKCSLCGVSYTPARTATLPVPSSGTATPIASSTPTLGTPQSKPPDTPQAVSDEGSIACPACTFLNHRSLRNCEICSTPLPRKSAVPARVQSASRPSTPVSSTDVMDGGSNGFDIVRLSFRKGGVQEAYRRLKNVLSDKAWERERSVSDGTRSHSRANSGALSPNTPRAAAGIDGIMQSISLDSKSQDGHMQDAFQDLEVLMVRAGEMVKMAQSLNARLTAQQASSTSAPVAEEDATLIRSSLVQLGLSAPALTQDMIKDEKKYQLGLAQELGRLLTGPPSTSQGLMSSKGLGMIALDEVWGLWMRARGIALLPPSTLVSILTLLPECTSPPIKTLALPSSMKVLYTPVYEPINLLSRMVDYLTVRDDDFLTHPIDTEASRAEVPATEPSLSLIDIASRENLPIGLAKELLDLIETLPSSPGYGQVFGIVRDDQADQASGGTRWYRDLISSWQI